MIRLIILLLVIVSLSLGLAWIADEPGKVAINWGVYNIEMSVLTLVAGIAALALAFMTVYWFFSVLIRSPRIWSQSRLAKRQSLGITALTETFAAIATQDTRGARRYLKRAEHLLPDQPLTLMLASQVARLEGNDSKSQQYLERMSKAGVTEFLSLRGMIDNARRTGDLATALNHAQKAYDMRPQDHWVALSLIGLYADSGRVDDALQHLQRAARKRAIHADEVHLIRAGLLCVDAKRLAANQQYDSAIFRLKDALRRNATFVPATVLLASIYSAKGDASLAFHTVGEGWKRNRHPEIGEEIIRTYDAAKDKVKSAKLIKKMVKRYPDSVEAQVLQARLAIKEKDNKTARDVLKQVLEKTGETSRICTILAGIAHDEGDHELSAHWHKRASESPAGADWTCNSCKRPANAWDFTCPQCGTVGSLV